jgi:hypothetical protein
MTTATANILKNPWAMTTTIKNSLNRMNVGKAN